MKTETIKWSNIKRLEATKTISKLFNNIDYLNDVCKELVINLKKQILDNNYKIDDDTLFQFIIENNSFDKINVSAFIIVEVD